MTNKVYNIRATQSFVDVLAERFIERYSENPQKLADVLFLMPNRRACQNLTEAFVRQSGLSPIILPRIAPVADLDDEEVYLTSASDILSALSPAISNDERIFIFTRLIMQGSRFGLKQVSLAQAYALAKSLGKLLDLIKNEELNTEDLKNLVPEEYSDHWQQTLLLLQIITSHWPHILAEKGMIDLADRRKNLLRAEMALWKKLNMAKPVILCGTTAAFPYLKELAECVINLPQGELYLYGLDTYLDDKSWQNIDENHPQFELKELLESLEISRFAVVNLPDEKISEKEKAVSEIMRPSSSSADWRNLGVNSLSENAFKHIHLVTTDDVRQEAQAIALILRRTMEEKDKTAALVTLDRNLSRRVVAELKKWNIYADDSAGQPLNLTPLGIYLRLIIDVLEQNTQTSVIALLKHPFTACGYERSQFNKMVHQIELAWRKQKKLNPDSELLLESFWHSFAELKDLYLQPRVKFIDIFKAHIKAAENLANTDIKKGGQIIWRKDAGKVAADFVSDLLMKGDGLDIIQTNDYSGFLNLLLSEKNVRNRYGAHRRIKILGPIEARLCRFDVTVLGEVNEGVWPKLPEADMWMSRPMKQQFGLPLPERSIGVAAADFANLLQAPEVYLTRAQKADGAPANKSRWWLRLETVLEANFATDDSDKEQNVKKFNFIYDNKFAYWAKMLDRREKMAALSAPMPKPVVSRRPRKLSANNVENLMRDPYVIYAKYVLSLYPLDDLDGEKLSVDFGNIVHEILQTFNDKYKSQFPEAGLARRELSELGEKFFADSGISLDVMAFWWPRYINIINWLVDVETSYRQNISEIHNEITGCINYIAPAGNFQITAKADRVDETKDGFINIIDYKTGKMRSSKEMVAGTAPQLPIEGLIAEKGGFEGIRARKVNSLRYWGFKDKAENYTDFEQTQQAAEKIDGILRELITEFDNPNRPYLTQNSSSKYSSNYEHLSRLLEWSVKDDEQ
ncbi:MAG: PD-(D/E)XK nuclease family protein [Alphaproteobacteria bacterium]|nr:PD-(D/E)XK nuclease family protein [Alphaproteobacteria bacterium]